MNTVRTLEILNELVSRKSITPDDGGIIDYCQSMLDGIGFQTRKLVFGDVTNLYARIGTTGPNLCFAGHIDVVPAIGSWSVSPFELTLKGDRVFGRGTNDMKGPLASALSAAESIILNEALPNDTSLSFLLTSDEELMGDYGTKKVVEFLKEKKEVINHCILCESSSIYGSGEYVKVGCRGSLNIDIKSEGMQTHVAMAPQLGNHIHNFIKLINNLITSNLDEGTSLFPPSSLQITSIDIGNNVRNIIPSLASTKLNIRFNDLWTQESLKEHILNISNGFILSFEHFGNAFVSSSPEFTDFLTDSILQTIGKKPYVGTEGGNSDALFIKDMCPTAEIGSPVVNAHIVNEYILLKDLQILYDIYSGIMKNYSSMRFQNI